MNYNANTGGRPPFGRKNKRVSDVNSMGYSPNPYEQGVQQGPSNLYPNLEADDTKFFQPGNGNQAQFEPTGFTSTPKLTAQNFGGYHQNQPSYPNTVPGVIPQTPLNVLNQPVVQDMALQYGQQLAGAGKTLIKNEVERYVPVSKLKYYFAVDTNYVVQKLILLFFPFTHKDWSIKYEEPVQPRYEINAPDLYIPTMAYVTYVFVAGLVLGMQERFSPEQIGMLASSALAWCLVELAVYTCTLYVIQVETRLKTLDFVAYSGYKFVAIVVSILISLLGGRTGFYCCLIYSNLALAFFILRSLKVAVLTESTQETSYYGSAPATAGYKRRLYFLLFVAGVQPVLSWWLSYHLLESGTKSNM